MSILSGFLTVCLCLFLLNLLENLQNLMMSFFTYLTACLNVKINEKNVKITKLEVLMNNIENVEGNVIGFEAPDYYDDEYYDDDEDKLKTNKNFKKNTIGFRKD
ncbi:MAG: hypothetical protein ACTTKD_07395 [Peptoanaerobacter stomatis]|uniref:hypothetical protein n=1 Tax=Peptoanaerobacter stomatis TaxID=796937 RepID=UPI003F9F3CC7